MNILFTGVGRRSYVIEDFKEALRPLGGAVFAMNSHPRSPALAAADRALLSPPASDPRFPEFLLEVCRRHTITAVCTLIDTDMQVLSSMRAPLAALGTRVVLVGPPVLDICRNKRSLAQWLADHGMPRIPTYGQLREVSVALESGMLDFPIIIKPRMGTGSVATYTAWDMDELPVLARRAGRELLESPIPHQPGYVADTALVFQKFFDGTEYNLDVVNDLRGRHQCTVVKEKLAMRAGETDIAITRSDSALEALGARLAGLTRHPFVLDVDLIVRQQVPYVLDMNPRIGGGYAFGRLAGVRYAEAMVRWLADDEADASSLLKPAADVLSMKGISLHLPPRFEDTDSVPLMRARGLVARMAHTPSRRGGRRKPAERRALTHALHSYGLERREPLDHGAQEGLQEAHLAVERDLADDRGVDFQQRGAAAGDDGGLAPGLGEVAHLAEAVAAAEGPQGRAAPAHRHLALAEQEEAVVDLALGGDFLSRLALLPAARAHQLPELGLRETGEEAELLHGEEALLRADLGLG